MIPQRIIQTHRSWASISCRDRECIENLRQHHPGWEWLFFSDVDCIDFVRTVFPEYLDLYLWFPKAVMRADLFRILSVLELGGFYFDVDVWLTNPLGPLIEAHAVLAVEEVLSPQEFDRRHPPETRGKTREVQLGNYAFGAEKDFGFLVDVLDELIARTEFINLENCRNTDVLFATGPDLLTHVWYNCGGRYEDVTLLKGGPYSFGDYGRHLMSGSWKT